MQKHIVIDGRIRRSSTGRYVDRLIEHLQSIDGATPVSGSSALHGDGETQTEPYPEYGEGALESSTPQGAESGGRVAGPAGKQDTAAWERRYTILVQPDDTWQPKAANFSRADCKYAQFSLNPLQQFGFASQLYKLRADVVHFPLNNQPVLYFGKTIVSTLDLTMLYYTRPGKTPLPIFWLKMAMFRFLFWYSNRKAAAVITISNYVKDELAKKYPFTRGKTTNTYNASEPPIQGQAAIPQVLATKFQIPNSKFRFIFYVGTAFPHKNLPKLIEAFEILHASQPELNLVLVGKKEKYYTELEQSVANSPARSNITFTGFIPDQELKWLYENAEAYVFPSLSEGFGLPGLEAMVHSCPVVSSNATCLPEVYGDAAIYFDPHNAQDMATKITTVISDESLKKDLVAKGHQQAAKYSWRRMAEQTQEIYQKALT